MSIAEKYALEAVAIGLHESRARSNANPTSYYQWLDLTQRQRAHWRAEAARIMSEYE